MAFKLEVKGLNELIQQMGKVPENAAKVASLALYDGAGVMADTLSNAVNSIATEPFKYAGGGKKRKPSPEEKQIIVNARRGIAKFRKTGDGVNTSVGFQNSGYAELNGETKPVPLIANSINSGTSFMQKQPFIRKAFSQGKGPATAAIEASIKAHEDELGIDN